MAVGTAVQDQPISTLRIGLERQMKTAELSPCTGINFQGMDAALVNSNEVYFRLAAAGLTGPVI